jgi:hypothetical protein
MEETVDDEDARSRRLRMKSGKMRADEKRPYRRPKLIAYGDFRTLTGVKGGKLGDGKAKGNTRLSGSKKQ